MDNHPTFNETRSAGLVTFILRLPEGQRHNGFFWAVNAAVEDDLPAAEINKVAEAGVAAGLDEAYVKRTVAEVSKRG